MPGESSDCSGASQRTAWLPDAGPSTSPANSTSLRTSPSMERTSSPSTWVCPESSRRPTNGLLGVTREPCPVQIMRLSSSSGERSPHSTNRGWPDRGARTQPLVSIVILPTGPASGESHCTSGPDRRSVVRSSERITGSSGPGARFKRTNGPAPTCNTFENRMAVAPRVWPSTTASTFRKTDRSTVIRPLGSERGESRLSVG